MKLAILGRWAWMERAVPPCKHAPPAAIHVGESSPDTGISWSLDSGILASCLLAVEPRLSNESPHTAHTSVGSVSLETLSHTSVLQETWPEETALTSHLLQAPLIPGRLLSVFSVQWYAVFSPCLKHHSEAPSPQRRPLGNLS